MKVRQLIKRLQEYDGELEVMVWNPEYDELEELWGVEEREYVETTTWEGQGAFVQVADGKGLPYIHLSW